MKIYVHRYELVPRWRPNARSRQAPRQGALIRVGDGFADLHPWPELGEPPLEAHLESLRERRPTPLAARSLDCARIDGEARAGDYSLFENLPIPPSHFPLGPPDRPLDLPILVAAGYDRLKIKCGSDPIRDAEKLMERAQSIIDGRFQLRLDFNFSYGLAELETFLNLLSPPMLSAIEFLEDPTPADGSLWRRIGSHWRIPIAADREKPSFDSWQVAVIKPASEGDAVVEQALAAAKPIVITTSMDHPLGQMWAAWNAAVLWRDRPGASLPGGLLSHDSYEPNAFSELLHNEGPRLLAPPGTGLGFDEQLERLEWSVLR